MTDHFLVFVYGTLKRGFPNHTRYMRQAHLLGTFRTRERYRLILNGNRYSPCMVAGSGQGHHVMGEVYAVDQAGLDTMDHLERIDRADGYRRHRITVDCADNASIDSQQVFVYLKAPEWVEDPRSESLETYTPELGRLYQSRPSTLSMGDADHDK